jgi:hypothetical protein
MRNFFTLLSLANGGLCGTAVVAGGETLGEGRATLGAAGTTDAAGAGLSLAANVVLHSATVYRAGSKCQIQNADSVHVLGPLGRLQGA